MLKEKIKSSIEKTKQTNIIKEQEKILNYFEKLKKIESRLWGIIITQLKNGQEIVIEDTNHLIYLITKENYEELNQILTQKDTLEFLNDLKTLKNDFLTLKKEIKEKETLKLLISNFTIKLVNTKNYSKFKEIFLLEKQLYEILDKQEDELNTLIQDFKNIKINTKENKIELFLTSLKNIRKILAGHLDNYEYFEQEREGFSNTSNIINELIKIFKTKIKFN